MIKSSEEYKKIYDEFRNTDSIKRKDEIIEEIKDTFIDLNRRIGLKLDELKLVEHNDEGWKFGYTRLLGDIYIDSDDDYYDIAEDRVGLTCEEYYAKGGHDKYGTILYPEMLDDEGFRNHIENIVQNHIAFIVKENNKFVEEIEKLKAKIRKNEEEVEFVKRRLNDLCSNQSSKTE